MFSVTVVGKHRILDFDIENRPLSYWFMDKTTAEITAIAWSWDNEEGISVNTLALPPKHEISMERMLRRFHQAYDEADVVTGHFIRGHDLPTINSALLEFGMPGLGPKMVQDTKVDLIKHANLAVSQKALAAMLDVPHPKIAMPQQRWRDANRLTPDGIRGTIERVMGDVRQHKAMRVEMVERGLLRPPSLWTP